MPHEHESIIEEVVTGVLEQLAFVFADRAEAEEMPAGTSGLIAVRMGVHGAANGVLTLVSGPEVCLELAANLTGAEPEDVEPELAGQALMELANVMCGRLLTEIAGTEPIFDLDPPTTLDNPGQAWQALLNDEQALAFLADDCPLLVRFELDELDNASATAAAA
jgi:CheY-specific phosphatase CheX